MVQGARYLTYLPPFSFWAQFSDTGKFTLACHITSKLNHFYIEQTVRSYQFMMFCKAVLINEILICTVAFLLNLLFQVFRILHQVV